jgi:hypothetical protein
MLLGCWSTALVAQPLKILPPALANSAQLVFFGSSVTLEGLLGGGAEVYSIEFGGPQQLTVAFAGLTPGSFRIEGNRQQVI